MKKEISEQLFKQQIKSAKNIVVTGFCWSGTPQLLLKLVRSSFEEDGKPNGLKIIFTSSATDPGIDHLAHPDLLSCSLGSYYGSIPEVRNLVQKNLIEGYSLPQGQLSLLFREIGRGSPGLISKVGLNTYVDPDFKGGKLNAVTNKDVIEKIKIEGKDFLLYKSFKIDTALIRGSKADKFGNISMEDEPVKTEYLSMAQATRTSGGKIYVQVCNVINEKLPPSKVDLPSHLVDFVILTKDIKKFHRHTNKYHYNKLLLNSYEKKIELNEDFDPHYKKIIAKKALSFIESNSNIILGQGIPELVGIQIRKNEKKFENITTFMESGVIGGIPERRPDFGVAFGPSSFLTQDNQFIGFNGGHMDTAILSFVEFDQNGNVNVSVLGDEYYGCGGYIDICHSAKTIIFVGSFKAKGLELEKLDGKIKIKNEGTITKAVKNVKEVTFSSKMQQRNCKIYIVTERCIFRIENRNIILIDVFEGIDINKNILNEMNFIPKISKTLM